MKFKIITTFLDKPLKASSIDISKLNDKAKRYWSRFEDETISRGMQLAKQANELLPDNASMRVYYEGDNLPESTEKVEFLPHPIEKIKEFQKRSSGKMIKKHFKVYDYHHYKNNINFKDGYDYEFDAVRFCHAPFSLIEAYNTIEERYLISIDADVVIREKIPEDFFPSLAQEGCITHYLNRAPHKHMESGFIMWDTQHPDYNAWWEKYKQLYEDDGIFDIYDGWTDCHAFDHVNEGFPSHKIASRQSHEVWAISPLQKYLTHNKGTTISS
tara:strand:- start:1890 stop:2702 length:813 start_codon:yes stop_codon:yes gene_type:complete